MALYDRSVHSPQAPSIAAPPLPFMKWNPLATRPDMPGYSLSPLRDDVPLLDPCSGFMSAGADADLRPKSGRRIPCLADESDVKPGQSDPWRKTMRFKAAAPLGSSAIAHTLYKPLVPEEEMIHLIHKGGTAWNSVARSDAALRAKLGGWTSNKKVIPQMTNGHGRSLVSMFVLKDTEDDFVKKCIYTSSTQRAYEEVPWDNKLPPKLQPPEFTLEQMADPVFTMKRYEPKPEIWQVTGDTWDRLQTRVFHGQKKPLTFISKYPRIDHIPGYCGFTGPVITEDIDNPRVDFTPSSKVRNLQPRYTSTAHTPNIPGYTGRVHWIAIHPANSNLPSPPLYADKKMNGSPIESRTGSAYKRQGPLSKMITTVPPCNPYNNMEKKNIS